MGIGQRGPTGSLANERGRATTASGAPACFLSGISGWFSLSLGAWVPKKLARRRMVSAGAMLLDRLGPPGLRFNDFRAPRLPYLSPLRGREGADGQAVVCPLLRGSSPTRGVAPKQHRVLRRAFSPAFRAGSHYPLARGCRRIWRGEGYNYGLWLRRRRQLRHDPIATARCCSTGSGRLDLDLMISGPRVYLICHP